MSRINLAKPWLIITIEISFRELIGKLLLCIEAKKRGWGCILASRKSICRHLGDLPKGGVFLVKSTLKNDEPYISHAINHGHKIVCLDEEGLVQTNLDDFISRRITKINFEKLSGYLVWGEKQARAIRKKIKDDYSVIRVTGHPRVDIWSGKYNYLFADEVNRIKKKYSR